MPARIVKIELGGDVDHGRLDEDADHPPVTGGNSATSRAPDSGASGPIIAPSIAARMRSGSAKADAPRSSRAPRDRTSVGEGKRGSVRVDLGGRRTMKKKKKKIKKKQT